MIAAVDVPGFDRANVDGFAIQATGLPTELAARNATSPPQSGEILAPGSTYPNGQFWHSDSHRHRRRCRGALMP
ncbi:MAG: hypothetical protein R3F37_07600 [Candidatus Competibacteraceae bacterium]